MAVADSQSFDTLSCERINDTVLLVRLDRPEVFNAMNTQMGADLKLLWESLYVDAAGADQEQPVPRCVVLTGRGEKAFCAGGDLKERNGMTDEQWLAQHALFEQMISAMMACPIPIIAAVNGAAYGGGCEIASGADFVYASKNARFALTEVTLGIMPGAMGTQNLPRAVGERRAKEIILTGKPFSAEQGKEWGLVNEVFAQQSELVEEALATAQRIAQNAPVAVRQAKKSVGMASQTSREVGYRYEIEAYNRMVSTQDRHEGVRAFNEKRTPEFVGR